MNPLPPLGSGSYRLILLITLPFLFCENCEKSLSPPPPSRPNLHHKPITTITLISLINYVLTQYSSNNPHISIKRNFKSINKHPFSPLHRISTPLSPQPPFHLFILTTAALCGTVLSPLTFNISPFFFLLKSWCCCSSVW